MPYVEGKSIWEWRASEEFDAINLDDEIMITVLRGDTGDKLGRLSKEVCGEPL